MIMCHELTSPLVLELPWDSSCHGIRISHLPPLRAIEYPLEASRNGSSERAQDPRQDDLAVCLAACFAAEAYHTCRTETIVMSSWPAHAAPLAVPYSESDLHDRICRIARRSSRHRGRFPAAFRGRLGRCRSTNEEKYRRRCPDSGLVFMMDRTRSARST